MGTEDGPSKPRQLWASARKLPDSARRRIRMPRPIYIVILVLVALTGVILIGKFYGPSTVIGTPDPQPSGPLTVVAADAFARSVSASWGSADVGGAYTLQGSGVDYNVADGFATALVPTSVTTRSAFLNQVIHRDVDIRVRVAVDKVVEGGNYFVYAVARRTSNNEYRARLIFNGTGTVTVDASVLVNGSESSIGPAVVVPGLAQAANAFIWLRAEVVGADPATIRVKAWADGQLEPESWHFTGTNSEVALQSSGAVGVRAYLTGSVNNAPVTFGFDDYSVTTRP